MQDTIGVFLFSAGNVNENKTTAEKALLHLISVMWQLFIL